MYKGFWLGNLMKGDQRRRNDTEMDIMKWDIEDMDWIDLDEDRERWWTVVSGLIKLRVAKHVRNFLTS